MTLERKLKKLFKRAVEFVAPQSLGTGVHVVAVNRNYLRIVERGAITLLFLFLLTWFMLYAVSTSKTGDQYKEQVIELRQKLLDKEVEMVKLERQQQNQMVALERGYLERVRQLKEQLNKAEQQLETLKRSAELQEGRAQSYQEAADTYGSLLRVARQRNNQLRHDKVKLQIQVGNKSVTPVQAAKYAASYIKWSRHYDYPLQAALQVGWVESRYRQDVKSQVGALGVMQVMPWWVDSLEFIPSKQHLETRPDLNIRAGIKILSDYSEQVGDDLQLTLTGYNQGITRVLNDEVLRGPQKRYLAQFDRAGYEVGQ